MSRWKDTNLLLSLLRRLVSEQPAVVQEQRRCFSIAAHHQSSSKTTDRQCISSFITRSQHRGKGSPASAGFRWSSTTPRAAGSGPSSTPVSYKSLGLTVVTGAGLWWYYDSMQRDKMSKVAEQGARTSVVAGKAAIGGDFQLTDDKGKPFHSDALKGAFSLLYFGFTHCPDVCPDELEKIAAAIDIIDAKAPKDMGLIKPVFITLDPERDGVEQIKHYVKEFHPRMIGLTGSMEDVTKVTKAYRVYFTKAGVGEMTGTSTEQDESDYLIDHSIITYLLDPNGTFVTFYGKNYTKEEMAASILDLMRAWKKES
ncbi:hypothetical protein M9435_005970 [Picochlorum sp. BPE23]|nr:hypothetical protein M9435_005970 [Picochlorum sp. BPE23]